MPLFKVGVAAMLALLLAACSEVSFYWQAGMGQLEIIGRRRPITEVLADESVPGETKRKLRLILDVQAFATEELALPGDGHYRYFTDLGRAYVSWLVVAAQPLSLEEHRFCYPIVGCLGYRGYFAKGDAEGLAGELRERGLDVAVRPVSAYSTLGWFDDPVLNTFLRGEDTVLIGTIIHEQTHGRYFVPGATAFNESFAGFVEEVGVRRFLAKDAARGPALLRRYQARRGERERFRSIVLKGRARLAGLYASALGEAGKRAEKARVFDEMRRDYQSERESFKIHNYDRWFAQPLNNAHLIGVAHYAIHAGAFRALFAEQGGDFGRFYMAVEALGALPVKEREARLNELEKQFVALSRHPR